MSEDLDTKKCWKGFEILAVKIVKIQIRRNIFLTFPILQVFQPIH